MRYPTTDEVLELFRDDAKQGDVILTAATGRMVKALGWSRRDRRRWNVVREDMPGLAILWLVQEGGGRVRVRLLGLDEAGCDTMLVFKERFEGIMESI